MIPGRDGAQIRDLLQRGFYSMAFQPVRETANSRPYGFEALLRGPLATPLANPQKLFHERPYLDLALLLDLDMACLGAALRSGRVFASSVKLFINVHGATLHNIVDCQGDLLDLLKEVHVHPSRLVLEISESTDSESLSHIAASLPLLKAMGIQIALDDVGGSFPWLDHLLWLEPDYLKLDHSLVHDLHASLRKQRLIRSLCDMALNAGAQCIAEGIETPEDWRAVCDLDVPYAQGFWLGRPCPARDWLRGDRPGMGSTGVAAVYESSCIEQDGGSFHDHKQDSGGRGL